MLALGTSALACNIGPGYEPAPDSLKAAPPEPKKPAPAATWEAKYGVKLTFQLPTKSTDPYDKPHCDFTLNGKKDAPTPELQLHCSHLPHPLEVTLEGKTQEVNQYATSPYDAFHFDADFNRRLGGVKLDALKEQLNVKFAIPLELTFKFGGYEPMKVSPPSVWVSSDVYMGWARGVRFSNPEPPDDGKMSAILLNEGYSGHMLVGEGARWTISTGSSSNATRRQALWSPATEARTCSGSKRISPSTIAARARWWRSTTSRRRARAARRASSPPGARSTRAR